MTIAIVVALVGLLLLVLTPLGGLGIFLLGCGVGMGVAGGV